MKIGSGAPPITATLKSRPSVAFLVDDLYQRRGVGSALRDELIAAAHARGARRLCAHVLPLNVGIRRLLTAPALQLIADRGDLLELVIADAS